MEPSSEKWPAEHPHGLWTLVTTAISLVLLLIGGLVIQPRLVERRTRIDDQFILTPNEVAALPSETLVVVLDREDGQDQNDFKYKLLQLILQRSEHPYALGFSTMIQSQDEAVEAISHGSDSQRNPMGLTVGVYGAGAAINQHLHPIEIPVAGGVLGLRAGWTYREELPALSTIQDITDLQDIVLLQGLGWSDVEIFDAAGLRTYTARPEELFRLVDNRRVQLFPRGIAELEDEEPVVHASTSRTVLDPYLLIAYPFAGFFYVDPDNQRLAQVIQSGFERAMEDGSYQELIDQTVFTPWLKKHLNLAKRTVVVLNNPNAAEVLSAVKPDHWIVPWHKLLQGNLNSGEELCAVRQLRALCD
jgi:hypothetical protein